MDLQQATPNPARRMAMAAASESPEHAAESIRFCTGISAQGLREMNRQGGLQQVLQRQRQLIAQVARLERAAARSAA